MAVGQWGREEFCQADAFLTVMQTTECYLQGKGNLSCFCLQFWLLRLELHQINFPLSSEELKLTAVTNVLLFFFFSFSFKIMIALLLVCQKLVKPSMVISFLLALEGKVPTSVSKLLGLEQRHLWCAR